jgi:adenylosuccinate synthase
MNDRLAIFVIDLAFGDCGKGAVVDHLARAHAAHTVVRFNGGPQAGHNVVTPDGRHHTFSQFGSGTFVPGVRTLLSRYMLIEPYAMLNEADHLRDVGVDDPLDRLTIDRRCPVITPFHQAANRLREIARGDAAHGTCGMGVGETMQDLLDRPDLAIRAGNLSDRTGVAAKLRAIRDYKLEQLHDVIAAAEPHPSARFALDTLRTPGWIDTAITTYAQVATATTIAEPRAVSDILRRPGTILFEGAQGVLLDEWFGFHPHTTWSTTTFANANALLDECNSTARRTRLGVLRTYFTRHGAGPLVSEDPALLARLPEPHNTAAGWQGHFRIGPFDAVAARYALAVAGGVDSIALTHLDRLPALPDHACTAYRARRADDDDFVTRDRDVITDLRVGRAEDLPRQERLTHLLRRSRPVLTPIPRDAEGFVGWLERELHTRVSLIASGPTADHQRAR